MTGRIRFVWAIKFQDQLGWFNEQLVEDVRDVNKCQGSGTVPEKEVKVSIYVIFDEDFIAEKPNLDSCCRPASQGAVKEVRPRSIKKGGSESKRLLPEDVVEVNSIYSSEKSLSDKSFADGTCCCKSTVTNETDGPVCMRSMRS